MKRNNFLDPAEILEEDLKPDLLFPSRLNLI